MQSYSRILGALLAATMGLLGFIGTSSSANAQSYNYGGPGVANVSVANGNAVIIRGDSGAQVPAQINAPLVAGDYLATGSGSNAELQFDGISMLRLAGNTQVRIVNLAPNSREVRVGGGTVDLAELQGADGNPQIDTPVVSVRPNQSGDYRVSVLGNGETLVTVRSGSATVSGANGSQTVTAGNTLVAYGNSMQLQNAIGFDSFDRFNISRDQALASAYNANPYISPQLAGFANLANYGQWQNVPGYGYAWAPNNQGSNFAPYSNGQWVWEPGYGYTWVDNAPYGYATSHYGTWFNNPNYGGWLWQPPAYQYQNSASSLASAFLPAVVSFFLSGNNGGSFDLSSLLGGLGGLGLLGNSSNADIGWIPLAPGEQYQPWYGPDYTYPSTAYMNVPTVTNVYNYYTNAQYYGGMSMIPVSAWRTANFTRIVRVRPQQVRRIVLVRGAVPVVPTTANLRYSTVRTVSHPITLSRTFAAPRLAAKAPPVTRISFKTQQAKIQSIVHVRPKVVTLPRKHTVAAHPVYRAAKHAPVHVTLMRPVTAHRTTTTKPVTGHRATRATKPVTTHRATTPTKPVTTHRATTPAKPVTTHRATTAKPITRHHVTTAPKPIIRHEAKPVTRPITKPRPASVAKPVVHPVVPKATPVSRPIVPLAKPAARPVVPAAKPAARPVAPVAKPAEHPVQKPAPHTNATSEPHGKPKATPRP